MQGPNHTTYMSHMLHKYVFPILLTLLLDVALRSPCDGNCEIESCCDPVTKGWVVRGGIPDTYW